MKFEKNSQPLHEPRSPDYAYTNGLHIVRSIYGSSTSQTEVTLDYGDLQPAADTLERAPRPERITRAFGSTALEGRRVRSVTDTGTDTVNIVFVGWGGDNDNPIAQEELMRHAAHNPHADIIQISNPSHGGSSRLPNTVSRTIAKTGNFGPQGEIQAALMQDVLNDYNHVNVAGHSYGARQAIAFAAALDQPVNNLHLLDPPGSRDLGGLPGIAKAFMSLEGKHAGLYGEHAPDQAAAEIQRLGDSTPLQDIATLVRKRGLFQQFFDQTQALAKEGLEHDLSLVCPNVRNTIKFTSPELSELNYIENVSAILRRVATASRPILHDVVLDHSHSFIASNQNILAYVQRFPQ